FTNGCVWDFIPIYSSEWDEQLWVHNDNGTPLPRNIFKHCLKESFKPFKTKIISGDIEVVADPDERIKAYNIEGACLYQKGFRFKASYKYCYKFNEVCQAFNKYR
ncbi:hypothetical protein HPC37_09105, partial [Pasteurellaceae bacterium 20609_3]|uniref:hypothetical protein n=1 Tax=Spirabiliibacterium mucosae TaxID=28156 RepID=UPI003D08CFC8|nr:hypothetical protein [Spirabiliibacterium mucosae]